MLKIDEVSSGIVLNYYVNMYQIPKGHKKNRTESELICAIREFEEETGLTPDKYKVHSNFSFTYDLHVNRTIYRMKYYLATLKADVTNIYVPKSREIEEVREYNINDVRMLCKTNKIDNEILMVPAYKAFDMLKYFKKS